MANHLLAKNFKISRPKQDVFNHIVNLKLFYIFSLFLLSLSFTLSASYQKQIAKPELISKEVKLVSGQSMTHIRTQSNKKNIVENSNQLNLRQTQKKVKSTAISSSQQLKEKKNTKTLQNNNQAKQYTKNPTLKIKPLNPMLLAKTINKPINVKSSHRQQRTNKTIAKRSKRAVLTNTNTNTNTTNITSHLRELQRVLDEISLANLEKYGSHLGRQNKINKTKKRLTPLSRNKVDYWTTVHSIESKQGKYLYRPRNKDRNCTRTLGPCGHHQLTVQALKDIGCHSKQCRIDRLNYDKSLILSKKLLALNEQRLRKSGINKLEDYQRYLIHQQGATGIKNILAASKGKKRLSKVIKKNMANNSPYSYKQYKRMGSTKAAKTFMKHWKKKWNSEQRVVLASL